MFTDKVLTRIRYMGLRPKAGICLVGLGKDAIPTFWPLFLNPEDPENQLLTWSWAAEPSRFPLEWVLKHEDLMLEPAGDSWDSNFWNINLSRQWKWENFTVLEMYCEGKFMRVPFELGMAMSLRDNAKIGKLFKDNPDWGLKMRMHNLR